MATALDVSAGMGGAPAPYTESATVRKATSADVPRFAAAMARSFYDDPVATWMMRDDAQRMRRLERGFTLFLERIYMRYDECYTTDGVVGGAVWAPPGEWKLGPLAQLSLLPRMAAIGGREMPSVLRVLNFMESKHPHDRHYYTPYVGVEPESQGRGIGSALIRPILERCDREGVAAYLEATTPRNRALYLRNGFEVVEELRVPKGGPPLWPMWREPRERGGQ